MQTYGSLTQESIRIVPFTLKEATQEEYAAINLLWNRLRAERLPNDPPIPLEEDIRRLQNVPPLMDWRIWCAWRESASQVVASGSVTLFHTSHNQHLLEFELDVLPDYRRQGLARRLLRLMVEVSRQEHRRLMLTSTTSTIPAGEAFLQHLGAQMGLAMHIYQLDLRDLNQSLLPAWQARVQERASGFELGVWTEGYPEDQIESVAAAYESMNLAPRGSLDVEDMHWTPEEIRQFQTSERARGGERWTMYVRDPATGRIAGITEVDWHPNRPAILQQRNTGVMPEYQGRGLGRWLKAAMLEKVLRDRPQVKWIRTGNADANAPMLKINQELGFKPFFSHCFWQIATERVGAYL